jgi:hypothetical protein
MPTDQGTNTVAELMRFFSTLNRPVGPAEFRAFWDICTEEEREEFRRVDLSGIRRNTFGRGS